jgi:hypothetical protein
MQELSFLLWLQAEGDEAIPAIVDQVLTSTKGTAFYILTVAGEHGVQEESAAEHEDETAAPESLPPYIQTINVPDSIIKAVKKQ